MYALLDLEFENPNTGFIAKSVIIIWIVGSQSRHLPVLALTSGKSRINATKFLQFSSKSGKLRATAMRILGT